MKGNSSKVTEMMHVDPHVNEYMIYILTYERI